MADSISLTSLNERSLYASHFMDMVLWEPYVRRVCQGHGMKYQRMNPGVPGTYPTFLVEVDDNGVRHSSRMITVKFFGPLFNGEASFNIEMIIGQWLEGQSLQIHSPSLLAEGQLESGWWYLIFEYVDGASFGQVRHLLSTQGMQNVAYQMGDYLHGLHGLRIDELPGLPHVIQPAWAGFAGFLNQQRCRVSSNHQAWQDLPAHLLDQVEDFVLPVEHLIDFSAPPHLIHADLTADHLLGRLLDGAWQTLAIIDWGDCMTGNILYESVAMHLDLFQSDRDLLQICLKAYDLPCFFRENFPQKALSMVLLHQFPMPASVYAPHQDIRCLDELADRLFGL